MVRDLLNIKMKTLKSFAKILKVLFCTVHHAHRFVWRLLHGQRRARISSYGACFMDCGAPRIARTAPFTERF